MKINSIYAKNFLSIGEPIEIDFTQYGNIVVIKGENRDQGPGASNGAGKSSILDVMVYAFFGELVKNLSHKEAINIRIKEKMEVQVNFELDGHDYKIIRKREPDKLEFWKDSINESKGGIPATQEEINKTIKLNYAAFINVVCFGQHNNKQFLGCKAADKRKIAENLLSLDKYNKYCELTKKKLKEFNAKLDSLTFIYDKSIQDVSNSEGQIKQLSRQQDDWKTSKISTIERLSGQLEKTRLEMSKVADSSTADNYKKLQLIEKELETKIPEKMKIVGKENYTLEEINKFKEENQNNILLIKESQYAFNRSKKEIENIKKHSDDLLSKDGGKCPLCYGLIQQSNFENVLKHNEEQMKIHIEESVIAEANLQTLQTKHKKIEDCVIKIRQFYDDFKMSELVLSREIKDLEQKKIVLSTALRQTASSALLLLEQQAEHLKEQIDQTNKELEEGDPYGKIIESIKIELEKLLLKSEEIKNEIKGIESKIPYYNFWVKAFGDTGIRSFVIGEIIPILNSKINYWMQFLVDNKIKLNFNNELEETIERNPFDADPFVYNAMSGGEHQRIDLGIALAFSQVMMLTSGTCPSIICLDEVGANLDRPGIQSVYNTICELSRERQVLVITHDPDLMEMLAGYETINLIKQDGYTHVEK